MKSLPSMPKHAQVRPSTPKHSQVRPSMPKHTQARPSTLNNYWEHMETFKKKIMKSLISKKPLRKERRTKQSLDSPQTIEANNKLST